MEMNISNTCIFADPVLTYNFLSVVNYINTLSDIFYNENLIGESEQYQFVPVLNTFFEYLNKSNDEIETKKNLVQILLQGSELYGSEKNETLDIGYVNATFEYIITNVVFSQFGGIYGYFSVMVHSSENLTLSIFKQNILDNLSQLSFLNEDGSIARLSLLVRENIVETLIFPLIPPTTENMQVIDVSFIYAQAGLILARSAGMNLTNLTFDDYISISLPIELAAFNNQINQSALQIFTLPALMYYAYKEKERFDEEKIAFLIKDDDFMSETFNVLFSNLNESFRKIEEKYNENDTLYQFMIAISNFKNRTVIAYENLRKYCSFDKESDYESAISNYKFSSSSPTAYGVLYTLKNLASQVNSFIDPLSAVKFTSTILDTNSFKDKWSCFHRNGTEFVIPKLEEDYSKHIDEIRDKYRLHLKVLILEAIPDDLIKLINSKGTTIPEVAQAIPMIGKNLSHQSKENLFNLRSLVFTIRRNNRDHLYAMVQNKSSITLLKQDGGNDQFLKILDVQSLFKIVSSIFKDRNETFETFVDRVSDFYAKHFRNELYEFGFDRTVGEIVLDTALSMFPFHDCVTQAKAGKYGESFVSCFLDVIGFIPLVGQSIRLGHQFTKAFVSSSMKIFALRQTMRLTLTDVFKESLGTIGGILKKVVLTKETFKNLSLGLMRALDPGFESAGTLLKSGKMLISELLKKTWKRIKEQFPASGVNFARYERIWTSLAKKADVKEMVAEKIVGEMNGYEVFVNTYPGGMKPYGPRYVHLQEGNAELRRMIGLKNEVPVVVSRDDIWGRVYYNRIDLKTGKIFGSELKLNENGLLHPVQDHVPIGVGKKASVLKNSGEICPGMSRSKRSPQTSRLTIWNRCHQGAFMSQRVMNIKEATEMVQLLPTSITTKRSFAKDIKNYFLAVRPDGDPNPIFIDRTRNVPSNELMPTYRQFAEDWIRTGQIDEKYQQWYFPDKEFLRETLNQNVVDSLEINDIDVLKAKESIANLYGKNYEVLTGLSVDNLLPEYVNNQVNKYVKFEEFFVMKNWILSDYPRILPGFNKNMHLKSALYKLAIRQADEELMKVPITLHFGEFMRGKSLCRMNEPGKTFTMKQFETALEEKYDYNPWPAFDENYKMRGEMGVIYDISLDSSYMAPSLDIIGHAHKGTRIIFPDTEFRVEKIEKREVYGKKVAVVTIRNVPIETEKWLFNMMKKIRTFQNKVTSRKIIQLS